MCVPVTYLRFVARNRSDRNSFRDKVTYAKNENMQNTVKMNEIKKGRLEFRFILNIFYSMHNDTIVTM